MLGSRQEEFLVGRNMQHENRLWAAFPVVWLLCYAQEKCKRMFFSLSFRNEIHCPFGKISCVCRLQSILPSGSGEQKKILSTQCTWIITSNYTFHRHSQRNIQLNFFLFNHEYRRFFIRIFFSVVVMEKILEVKNLWIYVMEIAARIRVYTYTNTHTSTSFNLAELIVLQLNLYTVYWAHSRDSVSFYKRA